MLKDQWCVGSPYVNPSQSYGASPAVWHHTVLLATRHAWTRRRLIPAKQAGTRFTYTRGTEGWVDLGGRLHTEMFAVTHSGRRIYLFIYL